ncbi:TAP42-like protein [Syncephalis pseudoplumigaleata]|uniref:TAP42-like protein n=1 Tax=Syncephalis pseudoplumigaleata TaxID=1712513 RepID=A0A4P9Z6X6_9FUNG|nr:TAP42-like protein [Syncephalis pseudoplumigaleata]|eukprot:RKP27631.1 TAP42-like protein [Syncephalis pseudoplumigaleata]
MSVADLFRQGQASYRALEDSPLSSGDAEFQRQLEEAIAKFEACARDVQALSLFSDNETLDDLATGHLRFVLLDAYLAELTIKRTNQRDSDPSSGARQRQAILDAATEKQYIERIVQGQMFKSSGTSSGKTEALMDAAKRREEKIERYKREKAAREKIDQLQHQLERAGEDDVDADTDALDRSLILALIQLFIQKAGEHLQSIEQEREMLKMMLDRAADSRFKADDASQLDKRAPSSSMMANAQGPLLSSSGQPLRPFVITSQREQLRQNVFRPGWRLPTMSIDEYLEQERERGNIIEGGGAESAKKTVIDEDNEAEVDAKTYKDREWDDFKDDNPRGWGNRKGKG